MDVSTELLRQNNWGECAKIQYLAWLARPGIRAEGSILIEFASPVVANRAIVTVQALSPDPMVPGYFRMLGY